MRVTLDNSHSVFSPHRVTWNDSYGFYVVPWASACCGVSALSYLDSIKFIIDKIGYHQFINELDDVMNIINAGYNAQTFQLIASEMQAEWVPKVFKGAKPIYTWQNRNEGESVCTIFMWYPFGEQLLEK